MRENCDPIRTYLTSIGSRPLLTPQQEIELTKQARAYFDLLKLPSASRGEVEWAKAAGISISELRGILRRGKRARDKLIECNMRLAVNVAKRYQGKGVPLHDLCQEGALGLARAVEKFDPTRGYKFSTYAYHWIMQAIIRGIHNTGSTIRLPVHVQASLSKLNKAIRQLSVELNRKPRLEEVAEAMEVPVEKVKGWLDTERRAFCRSLDAPLRNQLGEDDDLTLLNILSEQPQEPPDVMTADCETFWGCVSELPDRYGTVLKLRYREGLTLDECGTILGCSRERVRQIEVRARKLAKPSLAGFEKI